MQNRENLRFGTQNLKISRFDMQNLQNSRFAMQNLEILRFCMPNLEFWRFCMSNHACMLFFFGVFSATLIFGVCFSLRLSCYGDGNPSKPHLNLRGKHFLLLFCVICPCFLENCVLKIHLTRAIFSTLGDCFGTPLLRRFLLLSIHNYD